MRNFMDRKMISLQVRAESWLKRFLEKEDGDTNFVSIIVIIVIILAIAGIFRDQLTKAVRGVMDNLLGFLGVDG